MTRRSGPAQENTAQCGPTVNPQTANANGQRFTEQMPGTVSILVAEGAESGIQSKGLDTAFGGKQRGRGGCRDKASPKGPPRCRRRYQIQNAPPFHRPAQENAASPVTFCPITSVWMLSVPSYVFTVSRFAM